MATPQCPLLLVMCTGNVCRSPMAEALFKHHLAVRGLAAHVISRGLAAPVGRSPHPHAIEVARNHGIPIDEGKRAASVTTVELAQATAIFIMDAGHRLEIQRRYPSVSGKAFLLGQWENEEIEDPVNDPLPAFERAWIQCDAGVQSWIGRLSEAGLIRSTGII